jgi:hypothetical protein
MVVEGLGEEKGLSVTIVGERDMRMQLGEVKF